MLPAFPLGVVERRQRSLEVPLEFRAGLAFTLGSLEMPLDVVEVILQLLCGHARSMTRGCNAVRRTRGLAAPWGSWQRRVIASGRATSNVISHVALDCEVNLGHGR